MLKAKVVGPMDPECSGFMFQGLMLPILADMGDEQGFLMVHVGPNPVSAVPTPGIALPKGCMLVLIVPEYARQIRPELKKYERDKQAASTGLHRAPGAPA